MKNKMCVLKNEYELNHKECLDCNGNNQDCDKYISREGVEKETTQFIQRIDDGELLKRNEDNTYSFINSKMDKPFKYSYETLINDIKFKGKFRKLNLENLI